MRSSTYPTLFKRGIGLLVAQTLMQDDMETIDLILRFAVLFVCLKINLVSGGKFEAIVKLNRTPFIRNGCVFLFFFH